MKKETKKLSTKLGFVFIGVLGAVLTLVQLGLTYRFASSGEELDRLESQALVLGQSICRLREENSRLGSLTSLQARAEANGFVKTMQVVYLPSRLPVALGY